MEIFSPHDFYKTFMNCFKLYLYCLIYLLTHLRGKDYLHSVDDKTDAKKFISYVNKKKKSLQIRQEEDSRKGRFAYLCV